MFYRYVPLLKTKTGEAIALFNLPPSEKARIFPLFHVGESPPANFVRNMSVAWAGLPMGLDGGFNFQHTGNTTHFTTMFTQLRQAGILVIPSIDISAPPPCVTLVKSYTTPAEPNLVIKTSIGRVPHALGWAASHGWQPQNVDLVIDLKSIIAHDITLLAPVVVHQLSTLFAGGSAWRSVTLASSAAPKDLAGIPVGRSILQRLDWILWNTVYRDVPIKLDYGDYTISHPDLHEPPGPAMARASVSVRYATDNGWTLHRGNPTTGPYGQPMRVQYVAHAISLVAAPDFGGLPACWGDMRIQQIATAASGPGGRPQWVEITGNRHMSLVANRLP